MRIGLVGRHNDKGLGTITRNWRRFLPVTRTLVKLHKLGNRFAETEPWPDTTYCKNPDLVAEEWVRDIDVLVVLEFAKHERLFTVARERGIKSVLMVNYEFLPDPFAVRPDLFLCPSSVNLAAIPEGLPKVLIPTPVDLPAFPFRVRESVRTFVHNAGTLGAHGANGTRVFLDAIPLTRNRDLRFLLRSQVPLPSTPDDPRVQISGALDRQADLYAEGDVLVMPHRFRADSLPIAEAMASGMPVLSTDMPPFSEFCQFLVRFAREHPLSGRPLQRTVLARDVDPADLATTMDALAGMPLRDASRAARAYAESISWERLKARILEAIRP